MAPKKMVQDMVPNDRKTIRSIPVRTVSQKEFDDEIKSEVRAEARIEKAASKPKPKTPPQRASREPREPRKTTHRRSWILVTFVVLVISLGIIAAALSLVFSKGTVVVKPKTTSIVVSTSQTAKLNAEAPALAYEVVTTSEEMRADVTAVQKATIEKKAVGTVALYNNLSTASQKLFVGTRLSNTKGLIYRTASEVTIPGQTTVAGKIKPGSVSVKIIADQPGSEYNALLADLSGDFKVVAYKGGPKYDKIYARLTTNITGGYVGKQVSVASTTRAMAEKALQEKLTAKLIVSAKALVPKDHVSYDSAYKITFTSLEPTAQSTSSASVGVKATYTGYMFRADDLVRSFAKDQLAQFPAGGYSIVGLNALDFKQVATTGTAKSTSTIGFTLKGNIKIVGTVPVDKLKKELAGVRIQDTGPIIQRYGTVGGAYAKIFPVWMRSLPDSPDRITIDIQSE